MIVTIKGATFVQADRDHVWAALHDVECLALCIPGCRALTKVSDSAFMVTLQVWLGPVRLSFDGMVDIADHDPPRNLHLIGHGTGGRAGDATGTATINLFEQYDGCRLAYSIQADARGPISAAGSYILTGVGKTLAQCFATRFGHLVGQGYAGKPERVAQRV